MIAVDTNVLLRYLLQDDDRQSAKANHLFDTYNKILITDAVLVETLWTLKGKRYRLSKSQQLMVLNRLFSETGVYFECNKTLWLAINYFRLSKPVKVGSKTKDADFADILIAEKARTACRVLGEKFDGFYTFDTAAQQHEKAKRP